MQLRFPRLEFFFHRMELHFHSVELFFHSMEPFFHSIELFFHSMELRFQRALPLALALFCLAAGTVPAQRIGLLVEPPAAKIQEGDAWHRTITFAKAAAAGLDIDLEILHANGTQAGALKVLHQRIADEPPMKALLLWDFQEMAAPMALVCEAANLPYLFYGDPPHEDAFRSINPPLKYRLGAVRPNWDEAARETLMLLTAEARTRLSATETFEAVGIGTRRDGTVYALQKRGAEEGAQQTGSSLRQFVYCNEGVDDARRKVAGLLYRYPHVRLLFTGDAAVTEGVLKELPERGQRPGADLILNGVGATPANIAALQEGRLAVCIAGEDLSAGWGLVLLQEHLQAPEPAPQPVLHIYPLKLLTEAILMQRDLLLDPLRWEALDFSVFTEPAPDDDISRFDPARLRLR